MKSPRDESLSRAFAALADPTRRDIVARLTVGDATLADLAGAYDMSLQAVSKHLAVLEAAGLVTKRTEGRRKPVHLEADALGAVTSWIDHHHRAADERYRRLDRLLADDAPTPTEPTAPNASRPDRPPEGAHS